MEERALLFILGILIGVTLNSLLSRFSERKYILRVRELEQRILVLQDMLNGENENVD